jgi:hypothetical protein
VVGGVVPQPEVEAAAATERRRGIIGRMFIFAFLGWMSAVEWSGRWGLFIYSGMRFEGWLIGPAMYVS